MFQRRAWDAIHKSAASQANIPASHGGVPCQRARPSPSTETYTNIEVYMYKYEKYV